MAPLQQTLLDRIRLMGFDHAIGLDSARQQICQRDLGRGDAYAAQMTRDRPEGTSPTGTIGRANRLRHNVNRARIGPDRNGHNLPALNQRVRGSKP
jgi:hypothetical protein